MKSFAKIASLALVIGLALTLIWTTGTTKAQEQESSPLSSGIQSDLWSRVSEDQIASRGSRALIPEKYLTFNVDSARLRDSLRRSPEEFSDSARKSRNVIELPKPDGTFTRFRVEDSPILSPEIAKQHPTWRTYQAYSIDEPGVTARLDMTDSGFHGYVFALEGTYSIDPFQANDVDNYIVFYKKEFGAPLSGFHCRIDELLKDEPNLLEAQEPAILAPEFTHGSQLRTYRLAVATTFEYTNFFRQVGDTDAQAQARALAQVVTSVNRIDGVYRKELSVRFTLVSGTNLTYVVNPEVPADYGNAGSGADLTANQTNVDSVIGSANYDFGHLFETGNGGVAQLSSVCGASKARGLSGLPNPTGDPFDVDYVAHEMGHQMGGNHTFNAAPNCGSSTTIHRREPGSAVTIMGYAGICSSTSNVARNSIDTFHVYNLTESINFMAGAGGTCGTLATPNNPPVIGALTNYTIPFNTPFMLTANATDGDGNPLTYSWEQNDPGASQSNYPTTTDDDDIGLVFRPGFRSYLPTTSGSRSFPSLTYVLNNSNEAPILFSGTSATGTVCAGTCITGEDLPSAARTMNFRVTVRDGLGGISDAGTVVTVVNTTTPFKVTTQNTASTWTGNTNQTVTWDVSGTTGGGIDTANVKISLSTDGGQTFPTTVLASTANDGSESINVPNLPTTTARIKVEAVGNIFFDINDVNFTIVAGGGTPTPTNTPTATPTNTPTATPTNTPTATPTSTPTATPTPVSPPSASAVAANVTTAGGTAHIITTTYTDNTGINVSTLNGADHNITGPNLFGATATFVSVDVNTNGTTRVATYSLLPPGGSWDAVDNGTYVINMQPNQVLDIDGNPVPSGPIGSFTVNIAGPTPTPTNTPTATPTATPTSTPTATPTVTPTATPSATPTPVTSRVVRVEPVIGSPSGTVVVPVSIDSLGNEAGMGLSISFNTAVLTFQSVALGGGAPPNSTLTPNTNELAQGRVGVLFDSLSPIAVSPPARQVFLFTFAVSPNAPIGPTPITFGDSPILRSVSDSFGNTLADVSYANGAVTIAVAGPAGFEGDIAPRPNGDNNINVTDVVQLRRFVTSLDIITPGELQRADVAPRATFGDGNLTAGDVVQVRRYAASLDPLTPASGPVARPSLPDAVSSLIDDVYAYFFGRELRVGTAKIDGAQIVVPIELTSFGDEMATSFTLEYDSSRLSNPQIVLGDAAPEGSVLTVNTNEAGRVAVLVDGTEPVSASSASRRIVLITFDVAAEDNGVSEIRFTDTMAPRSVSGGNGDSLSTRYVNGSVRLTD